MAKVLNMKEIDGHKLKTLVEKNGGASAVARKIYRTPASVTNTISRGKITPAMVEALWDALGIPFDAYKKQNEEDGQITMQTPGDDMRKVIALLENIDEKLTQILGGKNEL